MTRMKSLKIDCISDLHGYLPQLPGGGDMLIIAGDLTACDEEIQYKRFFDWLKEQDYEIKIIVAGNHDGLLETPGETPEIITNYMDFEDTVYLCDSGFDWQGMYVYGSPWTPKFCNWYFMASRATLKKKWELIPDKTDILITHGPPKGILDEVADAHRKDSAGCVELAYACERVKPLLHVFGHIHEAYGIKELGSCTFVNASHVDFAYDAVNPPIRIEL